MKKPPTKNYIRKRLEYLRGELRAERISTLELVELQSYAAHIPAGDVELLEAAVVPEKPVPPLTQLEMNDSQVEFAERIAKRLGYKQTAYSSTSDFWGLYCLPENANHRAGVIVFTKEAGFLFIADLEDLKLNDLFEEQIKKYRHAKPKL